MSDAAREASLVLVIQINPPPAPRCTSMDRNMLLRHLAMAERHVALADTQITRQENLIANMDRRGRDTTKALALLKSLQATQALRVKDRKRLLAELAR